MTVSRKRCAFLQAALIWGLLSPMASLAAEEASPTTTPSRGDATADPLLLLLRSPAIWRELGLQTRQIEALAQTVGGVDEPLWRLRDAQFLNAENSQKAWQLIDQVEANLEGILEPPQLSRLRQLLIQTRKMDALLNREVIQRLGLSPEQVREIAAALEEIRKDARQLPKPAAGSSEAERTRATETLLATQRKKVGALLTDVQKRQFETWAGTPYPFATLPFRFARAPEIRGIEAWLNSTPLTLEELRGKVVILHFFTFSCRNCVHNQPAYHDWQQRFSAQDAVLIGIQTPEGESDRVRENIQKALQEQKITYPVAIDNQKETWTAWANHMWPAVYLLDREGYVRYWWYGELNWQGAQGEKLFRQRIAALLAEPRDSGERPALRRRLPEGKRLPP